MGRPLFRIEDRESCRHQASDELFQVDELVDDERGQRCRDVMRSRSVPVTPVSTSYRRSPRCATYGAHADRSAAASAQSDRSHLRVSTLRRRERRPRCH